MKALDKRQRAMLREIGIRVWQPMPNAALPTALNNPVSPAGPAIMPELAITNIAIRARIASPSAPLNAPKPLAQAAPGVAQTDNAPAWRVGAAQTLYAESAVKNAARWLVLLEAPESALLGTFNPLNGDEGKLLDNMLRAARLHTAGAVLLAPLARSGADGDLPGALAELFGSSKADVVLVMGRLAAQALLQSTEPLVKLRGKAHTVQGQSVIVTLDPNYLLRNPLDKAKAWDDLCLGLRLARDS